MSQTASKTANHTRNVAAKHVSAAIPLSQLKAGQRATIAAIEGRVDHVLRLEEFGLRAGTCIEMFRRGNPCILRIAGNKICLRADELLQIHVTPIAEKATPVAPQSRAGETPAPQ